MIRTCFLARPWVGGLRVVRREDANLGITHTKLLLGVYFVNFIDTKKIMRIAIVNKELKRKVVPKGGLDFPSFL